MYKPTPHQNTHQGWTVRYHYTRDSFYNIDSSSYQHGDADMLININMESAHSTVPNANLTQGLYPSPIQIGPQYRSTVCLDLSEWKTVQPAPKP